MGNPKISVIVPIYNAEKYLNRCIDSILNQTFTEIEVLLINDGSTDGSGVICDQYALLDSRVRVYHKENGGVSSARNVGIKNMTGEYSIHVDSDDWIESNMYEEMYSVAVRENADIVFCNYFINLKDKEHISEQSPLSLLPEEVSKNILEGRIHGSLCNKLIKTDIIRRSNLLLKENLIIREDLLFCLEVLQRVNTIHHVPKAFYHYVDVIGSLTSDLNLKAVLGLLNYIDHLKEFFKESNIPICFYHHQVLFVKLSLYNSGYFTSKFIINYEFDSNQSLCSIKHTSFYTKYILKYLFTGRLFMAQSLRLLRKLHNKINIYLS